LFCATPTAVPTRTKLRLRLQIHHTSKSLTEENKKTARVVDTLAAHFHDRGSDGGRMADLTFAPEPLEPLDHWLSVRVGLDSVGARTLEVHESDWVPV
jgi:hypothetical protein